MSIAFPMEDSRSSLDLVRPRRQVSARRVEANRRNALKSTGPRTAVGKRRVGRNALKHGLCALHPHLPSESEATFRIFIAELEEELQPRTVLQRNLFPQITSLLWNLQRLPEAQTRLFMEEAAKVETDDGAGLLSAADVLARRFSDDGGAGFLLMNRYERSMQNALLRLLRQYHALQKHHASIPYAPGEPPCPPERACMPEQTVHLSGDSEKIARSAARADQARQWHLRDEALEAAVEDPAGDSPEQAPGETIEPMEDGEKASAKQTQSKPAKNRVPDARAGKSTVSDGSPVTKQTHRANRAASPSSAAPTPAPPPRVERQRNSPARPLIQNPKSKIQNPKSINAPDPVR